MLTQPGLNQVTLLLALSAYAATAPAMDVFSIVPDGENAPESLVRVVASRVIGAGRVAVTAMQGPCKREAMIKTEFVIQTTQQIARDALFFKVPATEGQAGFSLRRATSSEVAMYERCRWQ